MKKLVYILALMLSSFVMKGQDPQFTQFFSNPLYLAPSFAGAIEASRVTAAYRNQWAGVGNPFSTYTFSFDHYFSNFSSGLGVLLLRDVAGDGNLGLTSINIQYSYNIELNHLWYLRPGLQFSYLQTGIDYNRLTFEYIQDPLTGSFSNGAAPAPPAAAKLSDIDGSVSMLLYTKRFWVGGSVDHIMTPQLSFYLTQNKWPIRFSAFGGYELIRKGRLLKPIDETVTFAALFRSQYNYKQLDFGMYWQNEPIVAGLWFRGLPKNDEERNLVQFADALAFLIGYKIEEFSLAYSYDFTISRLISSTYGSHEVTLVYNFKYQRKKRMGSVPCPRF